MPAFLLNRFPRPLIHAREPSPPSPPKGRSKRNTAPCPGSEVTEMLPPWASMILCTVAKASRSPAPWW